MTPEQHQTEHVRLHRALDELLACWLTETRDAGVGSIHGKVLDLLHWSYEKTMKPTPSPDHGHNRDDRSQADFESERQMVVLALAELALSRPGWEESLREIARHYDGEGLPTFEGFKMTSADRVKGERGALL